MNLSIPVSIALLVVYAVVTTISLRRHSRLHIASDEEIKGWSFKLSLGVLGAATVVTALVAEILVGSLEVFAEKIGVTEFFVAAVIVAIVGNAAEHGGAVVVAARGKITLATEIALASAAQVAVFLVPAVTLLALLIDPLALGFRVVEIAALTGGLVVTTIDLWSGQASKAAASCWSLRTSPSRSRSSSQATGKITARERRPRPAPPSRAAPERSADRRRGQQAIEERAVPGQRDPEILRRDVVARGPLTLEPVGLLREARSHPPGQVGDERIGRLARRRGATAQVSTASANAAGARVSG